MNHKSQISLFSALCMILILLSACGSPEVIPAPPQSTDTTTPPTNLPPATLTVGQPALSGRIDLEQGSGDICTANSTYFVYVDITSDGPATVEYRVDATDGSGQVPNGVFETNNTPEVKGTLTFESAGTQTIILRLIGPYGYPDSITIRAYANDSVMSIPVSCN
jgi:hypothetical protein